MKRILLIIIFALALTSMFCTFAFAVESAQETVPEATSENEAVEVPTETSTFFTRIWEFISKYKVESITLAGDTGIIALVVYILSKNSKAKKTVDTSLNAIKDVATSSLKNTTDFVVVVNKLIEAYNSQSEEYSKLREAYEKYGAEEGERNKAVGALTIEIMTLMEMLSTVYLNNANVTQGIKDMISAKYAKCLNAIKSDENMAAIITAAKSMLEAKNP